MANWSNPTLTSTYTDFLGELKNRDDDLAKQFDGTTSSNLATGTIRWNSTANRWQKWSGSAWAELTGTYALTALTTTGNANIGGTLAVTGAATLAAATATTPATGDNSTAVATTAYVRAQAYAPLASPALTGTPTVPTAAVNTNTTQAASTAFVNAEIANDAPTKTGTGASGTWGISVSGNAATVTTNANLTGDVTSVGNATSIAAGVIVNADISGSAGIADTKLATISTAGKVSGTAITSGNIATSGSIATTSHVQTSRIQNVETNDAIVLEPSDDSIQFITNGVEQLRIIASGKLGIGTTTPATTLDVNGDVTIADKIIHADDTNTAIRFPAADTVTVETDGSERVRVDSSGRLLVGTSTALNVSGSVGFEGFQVAGTGSGSNVSLSRWAATATSAVLSFAKSRSASIGTNTVVANGDSIGRLDFNAADGTSFVSAASIQAVVDGTPGANDMPGRLVFSTTADGASSPTERMRIRSDGNIGIGGNGDASVSLYNQAVITGSASSYANFTNATVQSDVTAVGYGYRTNLGTAAASFTTTIQHFAASADVIGSGSTVSNQYGFVAAATLTGATNNYGFFGNIASGTGRYNFYGNGTAPNYFAGDLRTNTVVTSRAAPANSNISATATASSLLDGLRTGTPTGNITLTLPTGADMDNAFQDLQTNQSFEWSVINLAAATHLITVTAAATGHTVVGNMAVAAASSGRFLTRKTAADTFVSYRIA